jgi:hypothetical protein
LQSNVEEEFESSPRCVEEGIKNNIPEMDIMREEQQIQPPEAKRLKTSSENAEGTTGKKPDPLQQFNFTISPPDTQ